MSVWQRWLRQPQSVWLRKTIFQVHLWTGIGVGSYVLAVCVTGSILVFRVELSNAFVAGPTFVTRSGERMSEDKLKEAARRAHPGYDVAQIWERKNPEEAIELRLERGEDRKLRLFNPYTGEDLGNPVPLGTRFVSWLLDLHDNLLYEETGRLLNGVGAIFLTLLCLTGSIIWWPGLKTWRRSVIIPRQLNWTRLNWHLHSAIGFWIFALILMWAITGVYLVFQESLMAVVDYFVPLDEESFEPRVVDEILRWLPRLHFGRFRNLGRFLELSLKVLWGVLGLAPAILFVTGGLMWWTRVVRKRARQPEAELDLVHTVAG
jgi:uncharacterized iron-regulated membrane protein